MWQKQELKDSLKDKNIYNLWFYSIYNNYIGSKLIVTSRLIAIYNLLPKLMLFKMIWDHIKAALGSIDWAKFAGLVPNYWLHQVHFQPFKAF